MKNPYMILGIRQDATNEQIEQARKYQLIFQCEANLNKKNEDGEYIQEVINQAADDLLNPEKRKEIDKEIGKIANFPVPYDSSFQSPSQIVLTKINHELIAQVPKIQLKRNIFEKKAKLGKFFLIILDNSSFLYAQEKIISNRCLLYEYFTGRRATYGFELGKCPWDDFKVFLCDGIPAIAYPAYRIFPISIIKNERIPDSTLRAIHPVIHTTVHNMKEEISELFKEYKVKSKGKK